MGQAKRKSLGVGQCIYCGSTEELTREHIIPYGLGGNLVLHDASCKSCSAETSRLEGRLLRGHWWPYRQFLGLRSRHDLEGMQDLPVKIKRKDGTVLAATIPMAKQSMAMVFEFDPPSILNGIVRTDEPNAPRVGMKLLAAPPTVVCLDGQEYILNSKEEEIEIPVNFDSADLCRFLAKVAHGYAISRRSISACKEYFLPPIILGKTLGAQTYVGGCSSPFIGRVLPGGGLHTAMDRVNGNYLTVYIQLFRDRGDPPPIYEVVVGRI